MIFNIYYQNCQRKSSTDKIALIRKNFLIKQAQQVFMPIPWGLERLGGPWRDTVDHQAQSGFPKK